MSLLVLNEAHPREMDAALSSPGEHLVADFVITYSASKILKDLGYDVLSNELRNFMKSLGGELVIRLATGHYKPGLANILLREVVKSQGFVSDEDLYNLLKNALDLKDLMSTAGADTVKSMSMTLFNEFSKLMCYDACEELRKVVNPEDPGDVLQVLATGIAVFVGGFHGV